MLVGTFQVEIGRIPQFLATVKHAVMGHAGVEPDIEGVGELFVVAGLGA